MFDFYNCKQGKHVGFKLFNKENVSAVCNCNKCVLSILCHHQLSLSEFKMFSHWAPLTHDQDCDSIPILFKMIKLACNIPRLATFPLTFLSFLFSGLHKAKCKRYWQSDSNIFQSKKYSLIYDSLIRREMKMTHFLLMPVSACFHSPRFISFRWIAVEGRDIC